MGSDWLEVRLSDAVDLIGGGTPKRSIPEYWGGTIPWLSVKDFNHDYRHVDSAEESITELGLAKSSTKLLLEGQLILSARGTVGALTQLSKPMAFNQSCYGINAKAEYATNDFLYYLLKSSIANLKRITHCAVFDTITREHELGTALVTCRGLSWTAEELDTILAGPVVEVVFDDDSIVIISLLPPKLISGDLRFPNAEKHVEGTV